MPPQIPKEGIAVEQQDERALALLNIMHADTVDRDKAVNKALRVINVCLAPGLSSAVPELFPGSYASRGTLKTMRDCRAVTVASDRVDQIIIAFNVERLPK